MAVLDAQRRRVRGVRGKRLLRCRGEHLERPNAHLYETGGMRRTHLRGHTNILKRLLVHTGAFNLGLLMRTLIGVGTPRGLQGRLAAVLTLVSVVWTRLLGLWRPSERSRAEDVSDFTPRRHFESLRGWASEWAV